MKKCFVYWIHLPEHTDMTSQGYIGITSTRLERRWEQHKQSAASGSNRPIGNAIRKHGESLLYSCVLVASLDYCLFVENALRVSPNTGWNLAVGGDKPPMQGREHSEETKRKISLAGTGRKASDETLKKMSKSSSGRKHKEETKELLSLLAIARGIPTVAIEAARIKNASLHPWQKPNASVEVWKIADLVYGTVLENPAYGIRTLGRLFGIDYSKFQVILRNIRSGWNPSSDPLWLATFK